jgi:hypothetical protein
LRNTGEFVQYAPALSSAAGTGSQA